jgi:hypothetical protein
MKKYSKGLFLYSLILTTLILLLFAFGDSKFLLLLAAILLTPVNFYFWISSTGLTEEGVQKSFAKGIVIYVVSVFCIASLLTGMAVYIYTTRIAKPLVIEADTAELDVKINDLNNEITKLKDEIIQKEEIIEDLKTQGVNDYQPPDDDKEVLGFVTLAGKTNSTNIYKETSSNSTVVATLTKGVVLPYYEKSGNWMFVITDDLISGWIDSSTVIETTGPSPSPLP